MGKNGRHNGMKVNSYLDEYISDGCIRQFRHFSDCLTPSYGLEIHFTFHKSYDLFFPEIISRNSKAGFFQQTLLVIKKLRLF